MDTLNHAIARRDILAVWWSKKLQEVHIQVLTLVQILKHNYNSLTLTFPMAVVTSRKVVVELNKIVNVKEIFLFPFSCRKMNLGT